MFEAVCHDDDVIGHAARIDDLTFFFGTAAGTHARLKARFPAARFAWLHQVHGRAVVDADVNVSAQADAHVTTATNLATGVVTADCVPVLLASRARVCGVHAGWRGVEADVIGAALARFPADDPVLIAAIGPHLGEASFEVGRDVADRLAAAAPPDLTDLARAHPEPAKVYFDLTRVARAQVTSRAPGVRLLEWTIDTLTSPAHHSYRRQRGANGRNLSFVVRNG